MNHHSGVFDVLWQHPDSMREIPELVHRPRVASQKQHAIPVAFKSKVRELLGGINEEDLMYFRPRVCPNKNKEQKFFAINQQFYDGLTTLFSSHAGEMFLAVHENNVTGHERQKKIRTDIYIGTIVDVVKNVLTQSGKVVFPTSRYVISQDCTEAFVRRDGKISEETIFGDHTNMLWMFHSCISNGRYILDFLFGNLEVEQWFKDRWGGIQKQHENSHHSGSRPFLFGDIVERLNAPLYKENHSFDYA